MQRTEAILVGEAVKVFAGALPVAGSVMPLTLGVNAQRFVRIDHSTSASLHIDLDHPEFFHNGLLFEIPFI